MKSMEQMQEEMLSRCYKKGGWPKPVHMGLGIMALAFNQDQYEELKKSAVSSMITGLALAVIFGIILVYFLTY